MDEPFGALDEQTRVGLANELMRLWERSPKPVVFVTHGIEEAITLADRVLVMSTRPGKIKEIVPCLLYTSILARYGVREPALTTVVDEIARDQHKWVDFMMRNELGLERPDTNAAPRSAALVGGGYALGGIFPLAAYVFIPEAHVALLWSCLFTSGALLAFGALRARYLKTPLLSGALTTWFIGALAAGAAYGIARLVSHGTA